MHPPGRDAPRPEEWRSGKAPDPGAMRRGQAKSAGSGDQAIARAEGRDREVMAFLLVSGGFFVSARRERRGFLPAQRRSGFASPGSLLRRAFRKGSSMPMHCCATLLLPIRQTPTPRGPVGQHGTEHRTAHHTCINLSGPGNMSGRVRNIEGSARCVRGLPHKSWLLP
jgi:hypothetical protein